MFPARPRRLPSRSTTPSSRAVTVSEAQALLLPLVIAFFLALVLAWPHRVHAQGAPGTQTASTDGTHTVRAGETLWSLAARYYGDGHKWRDLASLNGLGEGGERGIAVGQVLRVPMAAAPQAAARAAMAEAPPVTAPASVVTPAASATPQAPAPQVAASAEPPATTEVGAKAEAAKAEAAKAEAAKAEAAKAEAAKAAAASKTESPVTAAPSRAPVAEPLAPIAPPSAPASTPEPAAEPNRRIGLVRPAELSAARGPDNATIFIGPAPFDADTMSGTIWLTGTESFVAPATRRVGEFQAAPIALAGDAWKTTGRVRGRLQATGGSLARAQTQRVQLRDLVEITAPGGTEAAVGTQFVSVSSGADLGKGTRLALPTGILEVTSVGEKSLVARVTRLYGVVEQGQAIVPYVEAPAPSSEAVSPVEATVRWITDAPLLPSLQAYLVLTPVDDATLEPGDRFELFSRSETASRVAVVRVVRVTPEGATAIVTGQEQPAIKVGMQARRVGRAP